MIETSNQPSEYGFFRNLGQIRQALMDIKSQIDNQQQQNIIKFQQQQQQQQQQQPSSHQQLLQQQQDFKNYDMASKRARSVGQGMKRQYATNGFISPNQPNFDQYSNQENERYPPQYQVKRQNFFQDQLPPQFYQQQYNNQIDFDHSYSMILEHDNSMDFYNQQQFGRSAPQGSQRYQLFSNHSPVPRDKQFLSNNIFQQSQDGKTYHGAMNGTKQLNQTLMNGMKQNQVNNGSTLYDSHQSIKLSNSYGQQVKQFQDATMDLQGAEDIIELNSFNNGAHHLDPNTSQNSMIVSKSFNDNNQQGHGPSFNSQKVSQKEDPLSTTMVQKKQETLGCSESKQSPQESSTQSQTQSQPLQSQQQSQQQSQPEEKQKQQVAAQPLSIAEKLEIKFLKQTIDQFSDDNQIIYNNFMDSLKVIEALKKKIQEQEVVIFSTYDKLKVEYVKVNHSHKTTIEQNKNLEKMVKFWKNKFEKLKEGVKKSIQEELSHAGENHQVIQQLTAENTSLRELLNIKFEDGLIKKVEIKLDEIESDFYNNHCQKNPPPSDVEIKYMAASNNKFNKEFKKFVSVEKSFQPDNYFQQPKKSNLPGLFQKQQKDLKDVQQKALNQAQIIQQEDKLKEQDLPEEYDDEDEQDYSPPFSNTLKNQINNSKPEKDASDKAEDNKKKQDEDKLSSSNSQNKKTISEPPQQLAEEDSASTPSSSKNNGDNNNNSTNNAANANKAPPTIMSIKDKLSFQESSSKFENIMKQREMQAYLGQQQSEKVKQQQLNLLSGFAENDENFDEDEDDDEDEPVQQQIEKEEEKPVNEKTQQQNASLSKAKSNKPESLLIESDNSPEQYTLEPSQQYDFSHKASDVGTKPAESTLQRQVTSNIFNSTMSSNIRRTRKNDLHYHDDDQDQDQDQDDEDEDYENETMHDYYELSKQPIPAQKEVIDFADRARAKEFLKQQSEQLSQQMQNPKFFKSSSSDKNMSSAYSEQEQTPQQKQRLEFAKMMEKAKNTIQQNLSNNKMLAKTHKQDKFIESTKEGGEDEDDEIGINKMSDDSEKLPYQIDDYGNLDDHEDGDKEKHFENQDGQEDDEDEEEGDLKDDHQLKQSENNIPEDRFDVEYNDKDDENDEEEDDDDNIVFNKKDNIGSDDKITINPHEVEEEEDDYSGLQNEGEQNYDFDNLESLKKQPQLQNKNKRYVN